MINLILLILAFVVLIIGSYTDFKTREVPDWMNYGLIFSGIGLRFIYSAITFDWSFLLYGILGLIAFVIIGYIAFYSGQWGGGDAKMLMGLGAVIGLPLTFDPFPLLLIFLINILIVGGIYGFVWSIGLAIKNRKAFVKNLIQIAHNDKMVKIRKYTLILIITLVLGIIFFVKDQVLVWILISLLTILYLSFFLIIIVKAVEKSSMFKFVDPEELTEGDWIAKDYFVDGKKICGTKDLGIEKKQINLLIALKKKHKITKIKIKEGIPFIPSFLIAYVVSLSFGAWWMVLI